MCFIRDYVGFQFDGPTLHLLQPLSIKTKDGDLSFPGPGARDALCDMIGATVIHVEVVIPEKFVMTTSSGHTVSMDWPSETLLTQESMQFITPDPRDSQYW